jgi:hypothetical protein
VAIIQGGRSSARGHGPPNRCGAKPLIVCSQNYSIGHKALNSDGRFLARVHKAVAFGSYIGNADRIGDLDVAIDLVRREPDFRKHAEANNRRVNEEFERGRRFDSILDQLFWWQREAMLFLRDRRRGLSLQDYAPIREIVDASPHRVVFQKSAHRATRNARGRPTTNAH